jgi:prepilin-type N-terminal cleavage/methylation domain-containing protein
MKQRGFTVIELVVVIAFLIFAGILFFVQKNNLEVAGRDDKRKTAINAMYYGLEESFYKQNGYYPAEINDKNLTTLDSKLFTDPNGIKLGQTSEKINDEDIPVQSEYRYEPTCTDSKCKSYTLRADLEAEADYVKKSRNN